MQTKSWHDLPEDAIKWRHFVISWNKIFAKYRTRKVCAWVFFFVRFSYRLNVYQRCDRYCYDIETNNEGACKIENLILSLTSRSWHNRIYECDNCRLLPEISVTLQWAQKWNNVLDSSQIESIVDDCCTSYTVHTLLITQISTELTQWNKNIYFRTKC